MELLQGLNSKLKLKYQLVIQACHKTTQWTLWSFVCMFQPSIHINCLTIVFKMFILKTCKCWSNVKMSWENLICVIFFLNLWIYRAGIIILKIHENTFSLGMWMWTLFFKSDVVSHPWNTFENHNCWLSH